MAHQLAARAGRGVQVGAPARGGVQVLLDRPRLRVVGIHARAQPAELGQAEIAAAALGLRGAQQPAVRIELGRRERPRAALGQGGEQDVGGGVQVVLAVPADQLQVAGEGDIAFEDARAHPRRRQVRSAAVFGELQRRAAMADRQPAAAVGPALGGAGLQACLQRAFGQVLDQMEGPRSQLHRQRRIEQGVGTGLAGQQQAEGKSMDRHGWAPAKARRSGSQPRVTAGLRITPA